MRPFTLYIALLLLCALADEDTVVYRSPRDSGAPAVSVTVVIPPCDKGHIGGAAATEFAYDTANNKNELTCTPPTSAPTATMAIVANQIRYTSITCDTAKGWKAGDKAIQDHPGAITIACEQVTPCTVQPKAGVKFDQNTLTCTDGFNSLIEFNKNEYKSLKCDPATGQWTAPDDPTKSLADGVDKILEMTCAESCKSSGDGIKVEDTGSARKISCSEDFHHLFHGPHEMDGNQATCSVVEGWKFKQGGEEETVDSAQELKVECREACDAEMLTNVSRSKSTTDPKVREYKCDLPDAGAAKYGVEINGDYVYSSLQCSRDKGWMVNGKAVKGVKDPFEAPSLKCTPVRCVHSSHCDSVPDGHDCEKVQMTAIDTLGCPEMHQLYGIKRKHFYDKELRCRTVDDDRWYTRENRETHGKATAYDRNITVACLRKRCNKCERPAKIGDDNDFQKGKAESCAAFKCSLWTVKPAGSSTPQQYSGSVTCSSDKATEGKWLIDEKTEVEEAACIPRETREATVKCTEAAPLVTACNQNWTASFGCVQLSPPDSGNVSCPSGKKMFYKQRGAPLFQAKEGSKIECQKSTGQWRVERDGMKPDKLRRGGVIICGDSNPTPAAQQQQPPKDEDDVKKLATWLIVCSSIGGVLILAGVGAVIYSRIRHRRRGNSY